MSENRKSTSSRTTVAAIDIGTTYAGYAFSYKSNWTKVFMKKWEGGQSVTYKTPTALLLNPDKSFNSFGYEAEKTYACIATDGDDKGRSYKEYYFFHRFKMTLITSLTKRVHRETKCKDKNGREVKAMDVFTHSIRYLKDHLLQELCLYELRVDDINFVLTVPAIWDDTAKMFMREAAIGAGIPGNQLGIALESKAASIYFHLMHLDEIQRDNTTNSFIREPGLKYMVVNLGDGTIDITVHQLQENKTPGELVPAASGEWNGTNVDKAYRKFLEDIFGSGVLEIFESDPDNSIDYYDLWENFEVSKRKHIASMRSNSMSMFVPVPIVDVVKEQKQIKGTCHAIMNTCLRESKYYNTGIYSEGGKLRLPIEIFENFFRPTINEIVDHLSKMFRYELDSDVKTIFFVGGFCEYDLAQELLKRHFRNTKRLVFPCDASLAVLKGAVYFGHCKDLISRQDAMFTFGFEIWPKFDKFKHSIDRKKIVNGEERCRGVFLRIVSKGDPITPGLKKSQFFKPLEGDEHVLEFGVFLSNQRNPTYVDDSGCVKLGTVSIPLTKNERMTSAEIEESITFEETYIKVTAYNCKTKQRNERIFDLLSPEVCLPS